MGIDIFIAAVGILMLFAVMDLVVGVSNDAVNFLNSSLGSRVVPRYVIMIVASLGIMAGVTFSSGMMEIARKGIFVPQHFNMPELITIFVGVMLTDIILLDLFNTFGLPTSTTVSIVFELLGAAVAMSLIKIHHAGQSIADLATYINSSKALTIILGILLSVIVAFICGSVVQYISRFLFTFRFMDKVGKFGAVWGGVALSSILYFILVKGARGAVFLSDAQVLWINEHTWFLLGWTFAASAVLLQILLFLKVNIFKPIILVGTFALAMAFAANDLVNFIGVPLAGLFALKVAMASANPMTVPMSALGQKVQSDGYLLILAGIIMVVTLWFSRKARSVTETELTLGQQEEGPERFESNFIARRIVRMFISLYDILRSVIPSSIGAVIARRFDTQQYHDTDTSDTKPSFDMLRASVNLMVASMIISYATSHKLPLSTTYVTFMVSMGSSFADRAWGRDSAVYRVSGVMTVIGGWFLTAFLAFTVCGTFAVVIHFFKLWGVALLICIAGIIFWKNHSRHRLRVSEARADRVFNLKKVSDVRETISITFQHMSHLIGEIRKSLDRVIPGLADENVDMLRRERRRTKKIQHWTNIIIANLFKSLRLLQYDDAPIAFRYPAITRQLQKIADGHRDIVTRAYKHVSNNHAGLLPQQIEELQTIHDRFQEILRVVETVMKDHKALDSEKLRRMNKEIRSLSDRLTSHQIERIRNGESKTRLSILYYAVMGNYLMIAKQNLKLLRIFEESFSDVALQPDDDFE